jgi:polyhydroxybutyrate depolymerase
MEDSWGDGWNGNTFCIDINQDGLINTECTTLPSGSTGTDEFCVDLSVENMITCGGGAWQSEIFWTLSNSNGTTLATGGAPFEGCVGGSCENEIIESFEFNDNGQIRNYYLYRPNSIQDNAPLVFVLHGFGGSAGGMIGYSDMNAVAEEYGFAVCYPEGISDQSGSNFWNVGYAIHQNETVDDVAFLSSLANYLQDEYGFDSQNIFSTGFSNGGDMSYMLACQANDIFRAIAPVAGCMMEEIYSTCDSSPVPVLEIHGTNDNVTLWDGDMQNNDGWGAYYSTEEGIDSWVGTNECMGSEDILLPNTNTSDGSHVINHRYFDCSDNAEVWLYEVVGGGHDWPGSSGNMDIEASEEIWNFFSQFTSMLGDINGDGIINILDVILLVGVILDGEYIQSGDLNSDGSVDVLDIVSIVNIILGEDNE